MAKKKEESFNGLRAVTYTRVSTLEQKDTGFSIDEQKALLEEYAGREGIEIIKRYEDNESAKSTGRKAFAEMLNFLAEQPDDGCKTILVEKTDRLLRNLKDFIEIEEAGVKLHFVKEGIVLTPDSHSSERFIFGIKTLMAKQYVENLSEEASKGMLGKAKAGHWPSVAPIGYLNGKVDGKNRIVLDPESATIIRRMFEMYATGNVSLREVTVAANEWGLRTPRTKQRLKMATIHRILMNEIYTGNFWWKGVLYKGSHKPIVSQDLFNRVQDTIKRRARFRSTTQKHEFPFRGLLACGRCGCAMTAEIQKQRYVYYHCTGHKGKCGEPWVREEVIADAYSEALEQLRVDEDVMSWLVTALKEGHKDEKDFRRNIIDTLQRDYDRIQARMDRAYELYLDDKIDDARWQRDTNRWRMEQNRVEQDIKRHRSAGRSYVDDSVKILELGRNARQLYDSRPLEDKRAIVQLVFSNSIWNDGGLIPVFRNPFDIIADTNVSYLAEKEKPGSEKPGLEKWRGRRDSNPRPPA